MRSFQEKRRFHGWLYSKLSIAILLFVTFLLVRGIWNLYAKYDRSSNERNLSASKLNEAKQHLGELETKVNSLDTARGKEEEWRRNYQVAKPGEKVIIIVPDTPKN